MMNRMSPIHIKLPLSAYMHFNKHIRSEINQNIKYSDIGKIIAERWNIMSDIDKKPYYDLYIKDKERYKKERLLKKISERESETSNIVERALSTLL